MLFPELVLLLLRVVVVMIVVLVALVPLSNWHDAASSAKHWWKLRHSSSSVHSADWHAHCPLIHVGYSFNARLHTDASSRRHAWSPATVLFCMQGVTMDQGVAEG